MRHREESRAGRLPIEQDVEQFAIPYTPERFTLDEQRLLLPFFSNLDRPVFVIQHLPEEVIGALSSRYSRSAQSLRRMFLDEYVRPLLHTHDTNTKGATSGHSAGPGTEQPAELSRRFERFIANLHETGGADGVVNLQRGRLFFERWLAQFGDDSIAEMGGIHLCIEGLSNIASNEIEDKRIGISPLEKSSRYVSFVGRRPDGEYPFVVPGELRGTESEPSYRRAMNLLFDTLAQISEPYLDYIREKYPRGADETERSFQNARGAKRFDDLRDLLPFATQTNLALFGNGRAFEDLVNRLLDHPLGELRWLGQAMVRELDHAVPSFIRRVKTPRGADSQIYRSNLRQLQDRLAQELCGSDGEFQKPGVWARLIEATPDADIAILAAFVFAGARDRPFEDVRQKVAELSPEQRSGYLAEILAERQLGDPEAPRAEVRFRKVPRAFENAHFLFALWARGGDYRDLHRHRMLTQQRQRLTTRWGFDLERDVRDSVFVQPMKTALKQAADVFQSLTPWSASVAQYAVPFAYIQHWYARLTAREIYWLVELRTGPQGRPHYREICQLLAHLATEAYPGVFSGLRADMNSYSLARRESEKRQEQKLAQLTRPNEQEFPAANDPTAPQSGG